MSKEDAEGVAAARFPGRNISLSQDEDVLDTWCVCARVRACMLDCVVLLRARARMCVFLCAYLQGEHVHARGLGSALTHTCLINLQVFIRPVPILCVQLARQHAGLEGLLPNQVKALALVWPVACAPSVSRLILGIACCCRGSLVVALVPLHVLPRFFSFF